MCPGFLETDGGWGGGGVWGARAGGREEWGYHWGDGKVLETESGGGRRAL